MRCTTCGVNELTSGDYNGMCYQCRYKKQPNFVFNVQPNYGWVCPKCGSVYAPHITECSRCSGIRTYTSSTGTYTVTNLNNETRFSDEELEKINKKNHIH